MLGLVPTSLAWADQFQNAAPSRRVITLDDAANPTSPVSRPSPSPTVRINSNATTRVAQPAARVAQPNAATTVRPQQAPAQNFRPAPTFTPRPAPVQTFAPRPTPRPIATPTPKAAAKEESVDLNSLSSATPSNHAATGAQANSGSSHAGADPSGRGLNLQPNFKFFFDLWLINQPNVMDFTFKNIHSYTFIDLMPDNKLTFSFSFNLASRSNYFELGYQVNPRLSVRGGKILIPFDDTFPHTMYGGRPNLSVFFMNGQTAFLPDLWAEPGIAVKYRLLEQRNFHLDGTLYVTNGFQGNTQNPYPGAANNLYPEFGGLTTIDISDNNRDKAIGGRLESLWYRKFSLNGSFYTCRWSDQGSPDERLTALGIDSQLRFASTGTEFRAALISMNVNLPGDSFTRGGWYFEASQKFGVKRDWKGILRTGYRQNDNRVIEVSDQRLIGGVLVWRPGLVQWSFETWRDLNDVPGKTNFTLTALRAAVEL